jgi:hypothetical protein
VPAQGMGNSTSDLAVSTSTTMSLTFTTRQRRPAR